MTQNPKPPPALDRSERTGSTGLVLLLTIALVAVPFVLRGLPAPQATHAIVGLLTVLAVVGLLALFSYAVGFLQFAGQAAKNDVTKLVADTDGEGLLVTEGEQRIVYANPAYLALSGVRQGADPAPVVRLFSGAADVSEAVYRLAQAAREGKRASEEIRLSPPLGAAAGVESAAWYRLRVRRLDPAGGRAATLWSVADVTRERARHENAFQELQAAVDYLDHAPAGFFSAEPDGSIGYMNATLAGWLDYDLAQFGAGGLKVTDVVAGSGDALLSAVAGGPGAVRTEQFDIDLKRADGKSFPARLLHRVAFSADGQPGPSRTLVLSRAAGEEKGEDLRAAEVRYARFFNATPMAIASVRADGGVERANAAFARMLPGALKEGPAAGALFAAIAPADRPALEKALADAVAARADVPPVEGAFADDPAKSARFYFSPADKEADKAAAATLFALDTSEERKLRDNFAQSQKMQAVGQLAGGVAHDFNNVLTAIIGYSDLLLANHRPTDPAHQDIMQIKQNANRAASLVRQLLAFSRRQTLRPQVLRPDDVLSDVQPLLRKLAGDKVAIDVKHGRDLWTVKADVNQLEQVLVNLVVNARDAMPEGGRIALRSLNAPAGELAQYGEKPLLDAPADYVLIEVADDGHGIPPDVMEKIFEPFFTTKEVGKGTGLGLSMVYGIVKQTGGFIFCDSAPGRGATFRVFLPRHVEAATAAPAPAEAAPKPAANLTGSGTILLVEDEDAVRAFGARALKARGYKVIEAASGAEALEAMDKEGSTVDLIVSDVVMPEMDGPTMYGELRKRGAAPKVIFVSGYADDAFAKNLPADAEFGFLPKPFTLKQLIEAVKATVG